MRSHHADTAVPTAVESPDVVIVGAGVVGTSTAMALSQLDVDVVVIERRQDVGDEASRANSGITNSGWSPAPGSLESDLCLRSDGRWEALSERLGVRFRRVGCTVLALDEEEAALIPAMAERCETVGVEAQILKGDALAEVAPHASADAVLGLHIPAEGVVDSVRLSVAYAELAETNGVRFRLGEAVVDGVRQNGRITEIVTTRGRYRPKFVVNAAGVGADAVSEALGGEDFDVVARRGQWTLLDREFGKQVPSILTGVPGPLGHGPMVIPTAHGSVLVGPDAEDLPDKRDRATTTEGIADVLGRCRRLMPGLDLSFAIKTFAGLRPHSDPTYRVGWSESASNLLMAAGIRSTGVSSSPAMGEHLRDLLVAAGLPGSARPAARTSLDYERPLWWDLDGARVATDPLGRTVICACEKVTAADVHQALRPPLAATTIGGVARRTHATWGRCQGSACLSGVAFVTSLYADRPAWETPMNEPGSTIGVGETHG
ncbi:MAG TPA: FAD-dependent oxidoreductase [Nocardioides sp.]|uniref:NAD(P)/FAD-dependent oxidoreductase n=1 Tax=Nocardioides sp. TaxID=35761 RepID=UPI002E3804D2|nr:FAD-dependent oxidoreductase [Nocardioides sp.]HEX3929396.1 FAD-dependent oxidoreductase [Nocardioides sp.]